MSTRSDDAAAEADWQETPEFALECLYDDPLDPSELTIYAPDGQRFATEWVTADQSAAIPIDQIR